MEHCKETLEKTRDLNYFILISYYIKAVWTMREITWGNKECSNFILVGPCIVNQCQ